MTNNSTHVDKIIYDADYIRIRRCRHGVFAFLKNDAILGRSLDLYGEWAEPEIDLLMRALPAGGIVADVGAAVGTHTIPLAGKAGAVYAFEPQRVYHQLLCANIALNGLLNVVVERLAIGHKNEQALVPLLDPHIENNFAALTLVENEATTGDSVSIVRLDDLHFPSLHVLKIDVESMSWLAIAGAVETIRRHRPVVYVESHHHPQASALIIKQMGELGYRCWWHITPNFNPDNFYGNSENIFEGKRGDFNIACVHASVDVEPGDFLLPALAGDCWQAAAERWNALVRERLGG